VPQAPAALGQFREGDGQLIDRHDSRRALLFSANFLHKGVSEGPVPCHICRSFRAGKVDDSAFLDRLDQQTVAVQAALNVGKAFNRADLSAKSLNAPGWLLELPDFLESQVSLLFAEEKVKAISLAPFSSEWESFLQSAAGQGQGPSC